LHAMRFSGCSKSASRANSLCTAASRGCTKRIVVLMLSCPATYCNVNGSVGSVGPWGPCQRFRDERLRRREPECCDGFGCREGEGDSPDVLRSHIWQGGIAIRA